MLDVDSILQVQIGNSLLWYNEKFFSRYGGRPEIMYPGRRKKADTLSSKYFMFPDTWGGRGEE